MSIFHWHELCRLMHKERYEWKMMKLAQPPFSDAWLMSMVYKKADQRY
jgi:hypothetical protein